MEYLCIGLYLYVMLILFIYFTRCRLVVKSCNMLMWQNIIAILVDMCLQIAQLVAPVVAHCSPEGNIVMDPDASN